MERFGTTYLVRGHGYIKSLDDLRLVVNDAALDRFALLGVSQGAAVAIAFAAKLIDRPVKWTAERSESFLDKRAEWLEREAVGWRGDLIHVLDLLRVPQGRWSWALIGWALVLITGYWLSDLGQSSEFNLLALPLVGLLAWNAVVIEGGNVSRAAASTFSTASPRAAPGLRLNERVTAGSWHLRHAGNGRPPKYLHRPCPAVPPAFSKAAAISSTSTMSARARTHAARPDRFLRG